MVGWVDENFCPKNICNTTHSHTICHHPNRCQALKTKLNIKISIYTNDKLSAVIAFCCWRLLMLWWKSLVLNKTLIAQVILFWHTLTRNLRPTKMNHWQAAGFWCYEYIQAKQTSLFQFHVVDGAIPSMWQSSLPESLPTCHKCPRPRQQKAPTPLTTI